MIYDADMEQKIVAEILKDPTEPLTLPNWAYGNDGRVVVQVDGIPIDLHRHLHNILIRPLAYRERMFDQSGVAGNVNPYLFGVPLVGRSIRTVCGNGHSYAEVGEAPPNSRGYRCRQCLKDAIARSDKRPHAGPANSRKTHCPQNHEYTADNTIVYADGKRRCRKCRRERSLRYIHHLRSISKKGSR